MNQRILIAGQGLAGTLLARACERAGVDVEIADPGHEKASSRVGAGMITPVTGRRWVKTWRVETWLAPALEAYRDLEASLGGQWVRPMRVWRRFRDEAEKTFVLTKMADGGLAPFVTEVRAEGAWVDGAVQVDTAGLIAAARGYWRARGCLREAAIDVAAERRRGTAVIVAAGVHALPAFGFVPWETAWGEILEVEATGLAPGAILNGGHWVLPLEGGRARVGATYERAADVERMETSAAAREDLLASACTWLGREPGVLGQDGGWRVTTPDRRPCAGWHPDDPGLGLLGGLGSKGTLWAPALAAQWAEHLRTNAPFDPAIDVRRFARAGPV